MKICLIGPGFSEIPPKGWGAIESLLWDYKIYLEKNGQTVLIINDKNLNVVLQQCREFSPDVIHIQYDDYIFWANELQRICQKIYITSHYGYILQPHKYDTPYWGIFESFIKAPVKILALSEGIKNTYIMYGKKPEDIVVIHNGANVDKIQFRETPRYYNKSICLAKLTKRKRQNLLYHLNNIDFAGNYDNTIALPSRGYIGEMTKEQIYENLTDYANLVLLSDGEAHALVIMEAFAAGLGVVVSEYALENLDLSMPFIDFIPENKIFDVDYVKQIIENNKKKSLENRLNIRNYAQNNFDWDLIIKRYLGEIKK